MNKLTCKISKTEETLLWTIYLTPLEESELVEVTKNLLAVFRSIVGTKSKQIDKDIIEDCVEKKRFCCAFRRGKSEGYEKLEIASRKILAEHSIQIVDLD